MQDKKRIQVNFRLDENLLAAIQAKCKAENISQTDFITQALKAAIENDASLNNQLSKALSCLTLRLSHTETCLANCLALQQHLSERIANLEKQLMGDLQPAQEELLSKKHHQLSPTADLAAISDRILVEMRLGKQAPGYKAAKKALSRFISELGGDS
ncbi:ribbon-helix-helix domain-containing protein [Brasilonema sp. UFV-L1]|uniref:ribbon-helix-helix domain-containing protein n=1 Tax=Brasilonema sp. UFV-L1 TaxID=2234130 RepID=UPI00145F6865|nr:ribbon-helix-helix domain-containing protein [Brasilonema sp. UFV-L1]NMG09790.1 hypothetical protein [Brasilonema sp. UFV-L1]